MPENILSVKILATAPGVEKTFAGVAAATTKTQAALQKLPQAANQSTQALTNLGRVVQDAPFGFLGIANNLNPLLESFQRLKATTGTTGGALKALGSSLLGAGGLGFALSIVSSALIVFGDRLFGSSKKAKEAEDAIESLASKLAGQAATLTTLVGIIQNVNSSYQDKTDALKAINQEYDIYLKSLGIEEVTANNVAVAYERIVDAMLRQAVVKGIQDEIAKSVEETAKKIVQLQIAQEKQRLADEERNKGTKAAAARERERAQAIEFTRGAIESYSKGARDGVIAQQRFNNEQQTAIANAINYDERIQALKDSMLSGLSPLLNLTTKFGDLNIKLIEHKNKIKKLPDEYDELELSFRRTFAALKAAAEGFAGTAFENFGKIIEKDQKIRIKIRLDFSNGAGAAFDDFTKQIPVISTQLQKEVDRLTKNNPILLEADANLKLRIAKDKAIAENIKNFNDAVQGSIVGAAEGLAESFGDIVSGNQNIGKAIIGTIASLISQIGKALVAYGVVKKGIDQILKNPLIPGGFAIGLGLAAIAAASLLKSVAGRALGGPVRKGQPYVVGEAGRELFIPDTGGRIVSNTELAGMGRGRVQAGGMAVEVVGQLLLRGQDLVASLANANRSQGRLT